MIISELQNIFLPHVSQWRNLIRDSPELEEIISEWIEQSRHVDSASNFSSSWSGPSPLCRWAWNIKCYLKLKIFWDIPLVTPSTNYSLWKIKHVRGEASKGPSAIVCFLWKYPDKRRTNVENKYLTKAEIRQAQFFISLPILQFSSFEINENL